MKKMIVRFWGVMALALVMSAGNVSAAEDYGYREVEDGIQAEVIEPAQEEQQIQRLGDVGDAYNPLVTGTTMPEIRDQEGGNTCWSFASIALAEYSMLKQETVIDGSEQHLAYFTYNHGSDPLDNTDGDKLELADTNSNYISGGGNITFARYVLANWSGVASEDLAGLKYDATSAKDLDSKLEYNDIVHLQQARLIAIDGNQDLVKKYIKDWGAVAVSYFHNSAYLSEKGGYYCPLSNSSNHAVALIGWDDNYSCDNFKKYSDPNRNPEKNGAWLVRGSYGMGMGQGGYYWISYEDKGLLKANTAYAFNFESADNYDNNYQYDGAPATGKIETKSDSAWEANVFEAKATEYEKIKAVGFWTATNSLDYTIKIYTGLKTEDPESGTEVAEISGKTDCVGFYTVKLDEEIDLEKGEKFSVVINFKSGSKNINLPLEVSTEDNTTSWYKILVAAKEGQSFYKSGDNSTWTDSTSASTTRIKAGNLRIKAYTDNRVDIVYNLNDGTNAEENPEVTPNNTELELKDPVREGYTFAGWYTDEECTNLFTGEVNVAKKIEVIDEVEITKVQLDLYAKWTANEYDITFMDGEKEVETITVTYGENYILPEEAPKKDGCEFLGWYTEDGETKITAETTVGVDPARMLYAQWTANEYDITFMNGETVVGTRKVTYGGNYILPDEPKKNGYDFLGWFTEENGGTEINADMTVGVNPAAVLYAQWKAKEYTITFMDGTTEVGTQTVTYGKNYTLLDEPKKAGYDFLGWFTEENGGTEINTEMTVGVNPVAVLYAQWKAKEYTITFMDGTTEVGTQTVTYGGNYILPTLPAKEDYEFLGWYTEENGGTEILESMTVDENSVKTLYARWEEVQQYYTISYNLNGGTNAAGNPTQYLKSETLTLSNPTRSDYNFTGWYTDAGFTNRVTSLSNISENSVTLYARWERVTVTEPEIEVQQYYTISYYLNGGTNATGNPTQHSKLRDLSLNAPTREGYTFAGWYTDTNYTNQVTTLRNITANSVTLYANWVAEQYTITFMDDMTQVGTTTVTYGGNYILPEQPQKEGYDFLGWFTEENGGNEITAATAVELNATKTLYAHWYQNFYTIIYNLNEGTNATGNPERYSKAQTLTLGAPTRAGYNFRGWYTDAGFTNQVTSLVNITANQVTVYARWEEVVIEESSEERQSATATETYTITYKLNKGTNNAANPTQITAADTVSLKAPTRKNYTFTGWYLNNQKVTQLKDINGSVTLTAKWSKVSVKKATLAKVKKSGSKLKITSKKLSGAKGYYVQYATNSKFKSAKKIVNTKLTNTTPKLQKGKTYYVRVRAYKKDSTGAKIYGKYSNVKKITL